MIFLLSIVFLLGVSAYFIGVFAFPTVDRRKVGLAIGASGLLICVVLLVIVEKAARTLPIGARLLGPNEKVSNVRLPP